MALFDQTLLSESMEPVTYRCDNCKCSGPGMWLKNSDIEFIYDVLIGAEGLESQFLEKRFDLIRKCFLFLNNP